MWRFLFNFQGRINRAKAWLFFTLLLLAEGVLAAVGRAMIWVGDTVDTIQALALTDDIVMVLVYVGGAAINVALISLAVRRVHDRAKSGWWVLGYASAALVCAIASNALVNDAYADGRAPSDPGMLLMMAALAVIVWFLFELLVLKGSDGPNRFGPDPLAN